MITCKKIVFITTEFPPQPGGIGNHAFHVATHLQKSGKEVTVITDYRSENGAEEDAFDQQLKVKVQRIQRKGFIFRSYINRIYHAFRLVKHHDTVMLSGKFSIWTGGILSLFFKKKYIAVIHGSELLLPNSLLKKLSERSLIRFHHIISVSSYTKTLVDHLSLKKITVIPNGFSPPTGLTSISLQNSLKPIRLITVGNITERKGQENVVRALPLLLKYYPNLTYHMVGIPTLEEKIMQLASTLKVDQAITIHGKVDEPTKWKLLEDATCFIMLSQQTKEGDVEGFGIAILEANAVGLPAIGSTNCGIEDAIKAGYSGNLVPYNEPQKILEALQDIFTNYSTYSKQAKAWSTHFYWPDIISRYLAIIDTNSS